MSSRPARNAALPPDESQEAYRIAIGRRLRFLRRLRDIRYAADVDGLIRTTKGNVNYWEKGRARPLDGQTAVLADFYGVSLDYLIRGSARGLAPAMIRHLTREAAAWPNEDERATLTPRVPGT